MQNQLNRNVEFSEDWLIKEIIKTDFEERKDNNKQIIKISKIDLLKLVLKFVKLNKKGE